MTYGLIKVLRFLAAFLSIAVVAAVLSACSSLSPSASAKANKPLSSAMIQKIAAIGSTPGEAMVIRLFKESSELEVWKRTRSGEFKLLKIYEICTWAGVLGPKIREGDRQSPEGFYNVTPGLMNPESSYYLSFDTGFPNKFDRAYGRTGTNLMIHGACSSAGCYAMTDDQIAEIYGLVRESFKGGNGVVQLQLYPFRMTPANLARYRKDPNYDFWSNLKEGYDLFEIAKRPPTWDVCNRRYVFNVPAGIALNATEACPAYESDPSMTAALTAKQDADSAAVVRELADIETRAQYDATMAAKAAAEAEQAAAAEAAGKARGEAIGSFFSNIFGGNTAPAQTTAPKVINPALVAPIPAPRIRRS